MKRTLILLAFLMIGYLGIAQTYVSGSFSYNNGTGSFPQKASTSVEVGRSWGDLSLGICNGITSFTGGAYFSELRPTLTVYSKSNLSAFGTLGAGYIWNSPYYLITEYSGGVSLSINKNWAATLSAGGLHYDGSKTTIKYTFVGTGLTYIFKK